MWLWANWLLRLRGLGLFDFIFFIRTFWNETLLLIKKFDLVDQNVQVIKMLMIKELDLVDQNILE